MGGNSYLNTYCLAIGIVQVVLGFAIGHCIGSYVILISYPLGFAVLFHLYLYILFRVEGLSVSSGLGHACGVFGLTVGTI